MSFFTAFFTTSTFACGANLLMKNLFCLLASLLSLPVFAQKVDLDAEPVTVRYFFTNNLQVSGYQKRAATSISI